MKRIISLIMCAVLLLSTMAGLECSAFAASDCENAKEGKKYTHVFDSDSYDNYYYVFSAPKTDYYEINTTPAKSISSAESDLINVSVLDENKKMIELGEWSSAKNSYYTAVKLKKGKTYYFEISCWRDEKTKLTSIISKHTHSLKYDWIYKAEVGAKSSFDGAYWRSCDTCDYYKHADIAKIKTVSVSSSSYTYTGKNIKPAVKVKDENGKTVSSSNYSVTYYSGEKLNKKCKAAKNVGKYKIIVKFRGSFYEGTRTLYFSVVPKRTSISSISAGKKKFTLKWKKQTSQTSGYQIQYSTKSNFSSARLKTAGVKSTAATVSKLKAKTKYYVRIRTYKKTAQGTFYSSWSAKKTVKTK